MRLQFLFRITILGSFLFLYTALNSQNLNNQKTIRISYGNKNDQISIEKGGGEHWKPLFFSVDSNACIHIPDFYKKRIAVFSADGNFTRALQIPQGISPRMNYFNLTKNNNYITFDNGTLYHLAPNGVLLWKYSFGIGVIPLSVVPLDWCVLLLFPSQKNPLGESLLFSYSSAAPIGTMQLTDQNRSIPLIYVSDQERYTYRLKQMELLPERKWKTENLPDAFFMQRLENGSSWWSWQQLTEQTLWCMDKNGTAVRKNTIVFPPVPTEFKTDKDMDAAKEGSGFWTWITPSGLIYKNYFYENYMLITSYYP